MIWTIEIVPAEDLEDAVVRALEAGLTADEIGDEVEYAIETYEEDKDG
jgi:hypothetical protein